MEKEYAEVCKKNVEASRKVCWSVIHRVFASLEAGLKDESYMRPRGYGDFCAELDKGAQLYRSEKSNGFMAEEVLGEYLKEKNVVGRNIRAADNSLSEAQKKMEEDRVRLQEAKQQQAVLEMRSMMQQNAINDLKRTNEENIRQLEAKFEKEKERSQADLQRAVDAKLKEQRQMLEEGFKKRAEDMKKGIKKLEVEKKREEEKKPGFWAKLGGGVKSIGDALFGWMFR